MSSRKFTRPRTRVYDANYNIGENYYRDALHGLDRKYGVLPTETIEPPRRPERPLSFGNFDSLWEDREREKKLDAEHIGRQMEDELQGMRRISRARAREAPSAEVEFENAFASRREEVKRRYSDKLLDSVGLNSSTLAEESATLRRRRAERLARAEDEQRALRADTHKWTALGSSTAESQADEWATKSRALISKARLADIDSEMEEIAARGAARERRLAGLKQLLNGDSERSEQDVASIRLRKTVVTTSTEKRVI